VTSTHLVLTHWVVLIRPHCSLAQVVMGCLLAQIIPYLASVDEEASLQTEGHGVATVTCHQWEHPQALGLILLVHSRVTLGLVPEEGSLAGGTSVAQITTSLCHQEW
jgi:hypothetical protein